MVAPVFASHRQLVRAAAFYEERGEGSTLPEALRPRPYRSYDWACFGVGAVLAFIGSRASTRSQRS